METTVSIHAPVKSATIRKMQTDNSTVSFNPRARKERDGVDKGFEPLCDSFNPRARKERDICVFFERLFRKSFNPRARKERDDDRNIVRSAVFYVSIHAPVKSATYSVILHKPQLTMFQSTRP